MALMRYEPWSMLDQLRREMERGMSQPGGEGVSATDWVPAVDIQEDEECFTITADLPGVDPKNIEVHTENGMLTIKGERDSKKEEEGKNFKRVERAYGSFFRRFNLPDTADTSKIEAKSNQGVLSVRIPKQEKAQPRKITVEG
jgi:HSP20 family protein